VFSLLKLALIFVTYLAAPATGLFGAPAAAPKPGGLFGAAAPGNSLFPLFAHSYQLVSTDPSTAPTGGLFGAAPAPAAGGLFGTPGELLVLCRKQSSVLISRQDSSYSLVCFPLIL